jgi:hypothetical protein
VPLQRCAKGRRDADDAVSAGVTRPWSTGPGAGQMHRVKMLTRQLCGRANRARLQPRVLLAAYGHGYARAAAASRGSPRSAALVGLQCR